MIVLVGVLCMGVCVSFANKSKQYHPTIQARPDHPSTAPQPRKQQTQTHTHIRYPLIIPSTASLAHSQSYLLHLSSAHIPLRVSTSLFPTMFTAAPPSRAPGRSSFAAYGKRQHNAPGREQKKTRRQRVVYESGTLDRRLNNSSVFGIPWKRRVNPTSPLPHRAGLVHVCRRLCVLSRLP